MLFYFILLNYLLNVVILLNSLELNMSQCQNTEKILGYGHFVRVILSEGINSMASRNSQILFSFSSGSCTFLHGNVCRNAIYWTVLYNPTLDCTIITLMFGKTCNNIITSKTPQNLCFYQCPAARNCHILWIIASLNREHCTVYQFC